MLLPDLVDSVTRMAAGSSSRRGNPITLITDELRACLMAATVDGGSA